MNIANKEAFIEQLEREGKIKYPVTERVSYSLQLFTLLMISPRLQEQDFYTRLRRLQESEQTSPQAPSTAPANSAQTVKASLDAMRKEKNPQWVLNDEVAAVQALMKGAPEGDAATDKVISEELHQVEQEIKKNPHLKPFTQKVLALSGKKGNALYEKAIHIKAQLELLRTVEDTEAETIRKAIESNLHPTVLFDKNDQKLLIEQGIATLDMLYDKTQEGVLDNIRLMLAGDHVTEECAAVIFLQSKPELMQHLKSYMGQETINLISEQLGSYLYQKSDQILTPQLKKELVDAVASVSNIRRYVTKNKAALQQYLFSKKINPGQIASNLHLSYVMQKNNITSIDNMRKYLVYVSTLIAKVGVSFAHAVDQPAEFEQERQELLIHAKHISEVKSISNDDYKQFMTNVKDWIKEENMESGSRLSQQLFLFEAILHMKPEERPQQLANTLYAFVNPDVKTGPIAGAVAAINPQALHTFLTMRQMQQGQKGERIDFSYAEILKIALVQRNVSPDRRTITKPSILTLLKRTQESTPVVNTGDAHLDADELIRAFENTPDDKFYDLCHALLVKGGAL